MAQEPELHPEPGEFRRIEQRPPAGLRVGRVKPPLLQEAGIEGVIIGQALYTGAVSLPEAIREAGGG